MFAEFLNFLETVYFLFIERFFKYLHLVIRQHLMSRHNYIVLMWEGPVVEQIRK